MGKSREIVILIAFCRAEERDVEVITSTDITEELFELVGEFPRQRTVTRSMNHLVDIGLVEKSPAPGMSKDWRITSEGRAVLQKLGEEIAAVSDDRSNGGPRT